MLEGARPGPTVLLRGDMDALPMPEDTGLDFASEVAGRHARLRPRHPRRDAGRRRPSCSRPGRPSWPAGCVFMWQPGEEGFGGAPIMLEEGVLDAAGAAVESAFALHITTQQPVRRRSPSGRGPAMASSDTVRITVTGRGGHASNPHRRRSTRSRSRRAIVQAIQAMVTREVERVRPGGGDDRQDHRRHHATT